MTAPLCIYPLAGLPEITPAHDLAALLARALEDLGLCPLEDGDVLCVAQKVVSKAEGRLVPLAEVEPGPFARQWAARWQRDARLVALVLQESARIIRQERGLLIVETHQGLVCANAGIDLSNAGAAQQAVLLPKDANRSARRLRHRLLERAQGLPAAAEPPAALRLGVLIADSFGRPWRIGLTQAVIGAAGMPLLADFTQVQDPQGHTLQATQICIADELAAAADLVCSKLRRIPAALLRGFSWPGSTEHSAQQLIRTPESDLFR